MSSRAGALIGMLRPHQWTKNLLVFVSLIAGHQYTDTRLIELTLLCFVSLCLVASGGYVLNDLADVRDDRQHPLKRQRPIAAGQVGRTSACAVALSLLGGGLALAWLVSPSVFACVAAYVLGATLYTFWAKHKLLLDIIVLAALYTSRIVAGVAVAQLVPSFWLLAFSMFLFASLATLKRFVELIERPAQALAEFSMRAYASEDRSIIAMIGVANGFLSILVLAFYLNSEEVTQLYTDPVLLWLICPLFMYWVGRIWLLASRGLVHGDPILFALRDRLSYLLLAIVLAIGLAAT